MGVSSSIDADEYISIVREALDDFRQVPSPTAIKTLMSLKAKTFETALPLATYNMGLEDFLGEDYLSKARMDGVQYFMLDRKEVYASVELRLTGDEPKAALSGIIHGRLIDATVTSIGHAENLPETADNDYDLRILEIPGVNCSLLWLHSDDEKIDDLFVSRIATPAERTRNPYFTAQEVKDIFGERAAANLSFLRADNPCPSIPFAENCD